MCDRIQPCKTMDQKVYATEMNEGGPEKIYGLRMTKRF